MKTDLSHHDDFVGLAIENGSNPDQPYSENEADRRKELVEDLFEKAEVYARTTVELVKLKALEKAAESMSFLVTRVAVGILCTFFLLLISVGVALWIGSLMDHLYAGFFIVSGIYLCSALLVYIFRRSIIQKPIIKAFVSSFLK
jgi:hypothetical protein